jgi:hypothetical protein
MSEQQKLNPESKPVTYDDVLSSLRSLTNIVERNEIAVMEYRKDTNRKIADTDRKIEEYNKRAEKEIAQSRKSLSEWTDSFGLYTERLVLAQAIKKFNAIGYGFTVQVERVQLKDPTGRTVAEFDCLLENGEYIMLIEVKKRLKSSDVDDHIERLEKFRRYYFKNPNDERKVIGTVAGVVIDKDVYGYAMKKGLYVLEPSGESFRIVPQPNGFSLRYW